MIRLRLLALCSLAALLGTAAPARAQSPSPGENAQATPVLPAAPDAGDTPIESMRKARSFFEYGDYASTAKLLGKLIDGGKFESAELRGEAWRLLGLSDFYQGKKSDAYKAFVEMLYLNPDAELDPFYVPPAAVAFFEQVKKESEPRLQPMRKLRHAQEEERRKLAVAEAQQRDLEEEQRRLALVAPTVERRVVQREFWVSLLPFGVGQIQNGDRNLGIALATSEVIAGATSAGSALLIESLRDGSSGKFGDSVYPLARRLNVAKWVGAGVFYALWIGGALHAAVNYKGETELPDRLVISQSPLARLPPEPLPAPSMPPGLQLTPRPGAATPPFAPPPAPAPNAPVQAAPAPAGAGSP